MCEQATIFTFGSNEEGRHGRGAALCALRQHGAVYGQGFGLQGRSFAVPTKGQDERGRLYTLPLPTIAVYVARFLDFARQNAELTFNVTRLGCGLAGYRDDQVAPMFRDAPPNCALPDEWIPFTRPNATAEERPPARARSLDELTTGELTAGTQD